MIKEESSKLQSADDLIVINELRGNQKGARKTMPSAKICHSESKIVNSRLIRSGIPLSSIYMSNALNGGLFQVTPTSSNSNIGSESELEVRKVKEQTAANGDKPVKCQESVKSIVEETSGEPLSSLTKSDSLGNGRSIYAKRPLEFKNLSITDSAEEFVRFSDVHAGILSNDEIRKSPLDQERSVGNRPALFMRSSPNELIPKRNIFVVNAVLSNSRLLPIQSMKKKNDDPASKLPVSHDFLQNLQPIKGQARKSVKRVRFTDKSNVNPQVNTHVVNDPNANIAVEGVHCGADTGKKRISKMQAKGNVKRRHLPNVLSHNISGNEMLHISSTSESKKNKFPHEVPYWPGFNLKNSNEARPASFAISPIYDYAGKNGQVPQDCTIPGQSLYRMMGTATRANEISDVEKQRSTSVAFTGRQRFEPHAHNINHGNSTGFVLQPATWQQCKPNSSKFINTVESVNALNRIRDSESMHGQVYIRPANMKVLQSEMMVPTPSGILRRETPVVNENRCDLENIKEESLKTVQEKIKLEEAQKKLIKLFDLLLDIDKTFSGGFECPGLENSLLIWKLELEQCILSVERIKKVLTDYNETSK